jgi:hypothetical protein
MKHLICILAHKNASHLELLTSECLQRGYEVIIHIDKKNRKQLLQDSELLKKHTLKESIDVTRAHITIVEASLLLLKAAKDVNYDYVHVISGEDFIVKSANCFETFFSEHKGRNFVNNNLLPVNLNTEPQRDKLFSACTVFKDRINTDNYSSWYYENGMGLLNTYYVRPGSLGDKLIKLLTPTYRLRKIHKRLARRKLPKKQYYAGSAWFSITKEMAQYLTDETAASPDFYTFFEKSLFPDETYFHTLALNSPLAETIINSDLRYIPWDNPVNFGPRPINISELGDIANSNGFFARKMDLEADTKLKEQIYNTLYDTE